MKKPLLWIVDDEEDIAEFVAVTGESIGFECKIETNAKKFQQACDLGLTSGIVMDIVMPEVDGNELLQWLAEQENTPPIVLMSGYGTYLATAEDLGEAKGAVIVRSLAKPIDLGELTSILQEIYSAQY